MKNFLLLFLILSFSSTVFAMNVTNEAIGVKVFQKQGCELQPSDIHVRVFTKKWPSSQYACINKSLPEGHSFSYRPQGDSILKPCNPSNAGGYKVDLSVGGQCQCNTAFKSTSATGNVVFGESDISSIKCNSIPPAE